MNQQSDMFFIHRMQHKYRDASHYANYGLFAVALLVAILAVTLFSQPAGGEETIAERFGGFKMHNTSMVHHR